MRTTARAHPTRRLVIRVLLILGVVVALLQIPFGVISGELHSHSIGDDYLLLMLVLAIVGYLLLGALIVARQPDNRIGWLFIALAIVIELWSTSQAYGVYALIVRPGWLPLPILIAWISHWSLAAGLVLFIPIFLLFPDGRLPSHRWRPVMWTWAIGSGIAILGFALDQTTIAIGNGNCSTQSTFDVQGNATACIQSPIHLARFGHLITTVTGIGGLATSVTAVATCVAVVMRFRRARGDERQQTKWLAFVGVAFVSTFFLNTFFLGDLPEDSPVAWVGHAGFATVATLLVLGLPAACGIAILKYHLYDLDIVIRKTVVFSLLAVFITAVYAGIVGGVGALVRSSGSTTLSFVAAAALAVLFQPARDRARKVADRLVYGKRATPYEVLAEFSDRMSETYASEDVLARMSHVLQAGTGAGSAVVWLRVGNEMRPAAVRPQGAEAPERLPEGAVEVFHQGELLGALTVQMPPSDPMNPAKDKLVRDLASQAGLVLRNVRLIEELRASRQRLVAAQDEERRKIERNLHDGAQQQLVALQVKLRLAGQLLDRDAPEAPGTIAGLQQDAVSALEDLRDLARGIYPPLLADKGLAAALEAQARKAAVPVQVDADGLGRYTRDVESAVYFCVLECLQNIAKHAEASSAAVSLAQHDGRLEFAVTDDGRGFDPEATGYGTGLQGIADRVDAIGGALAVRSTPGLGTTITGHIKASAMETT
jgi:signal transduction histidine kinase